MEDVSDVNYAVRPPEGSTGVVATLSSTATAVEPGIVTELAVTVHNTGALVDQFRVEVLGPASAWVRVTPPVVALFPGSEAVVRLLFQPPRDSALLAEEVAFGVKVTSETAPSTSTVEEGVVRVGVFRDVDADLRPRTATGRRKARFDLVHENRGNRPTTMVLSGSDDETLLAFSMAAAVTVLPGHTQLTRVKVAAEKRFWFGPTRTRPFTLQSEVEGEEPTIVPGGTQTPTEVMYATVNYDAGSRQLTWIGVNSDATQQAGNTVREDRVIATIVCGSEGSCVIATLEVDPSAPRTLLIRTNGGTSIIDERFVVNIWS